MERSGAVTSVPRPGVGVQVVRPRVGIAVLLEDHGVAVEPLLVHVAGHYERGVDLQAAVNAPCGDDRRRSGGRRSGRDRWDEVELREPDSPVAVPVAHPGRLGEIDALVVAPICTEAHDPPACPAVELVVDTPRLPVFLPEKTWLGWRQPHVGPCTGPQPRRGCSFTDIRRMRSNPYPVRGGRRHGRTPRQAHRCDETRMSRFIARTLCPPAESSVACGSNVTRKGCRYAFVVSTTKAPVSIAIPFARRCSRSPRGPSSGNNGP